MMFLSSWLKDAPSGFEQSCRSPCNVKQEQSLCPRLKQWWPRPSSVQDSGWNTAYDGLLRGALGEPGGRALSQESGPSMGTEFIP